LIFLFVLVKIFDCDAFHTNYSRWQIPAVYDFRDRHDIQLLQTEKVFIDNLKLILSGPGASGSRPMPDGRQQEPGGWNRIILQVKDLPARIEALKKAGLHFRNEMEVGPGGKQIQLEDPDGNPIELFEPAG